MAKTKVVLALFICLSRISTFEEPLDRDIAILAVVSHEILEGKLLYGDVWDQKLPLNHITFIAAKLIAGYDLGAVYFIGCVFAIIALFRVCAAASYLTKPEIGEEFGRHYFGLLFPGIESYREINLIRKSL